MREARIANVVAGVLRQAVCDAGAAGVVVLDDGSAEAGLAARWAERGLGAARVWRVQAPADAGADEAEEARRFAARQEAARRGALLCHPANKTALLLGGPLPPEPLLPLGDLYASQVEELAGGWTAPGAVLELAREAGGVPRVDEILTMILDERRSAAAVTALRPEFAPRVLEALARARFWRQRCGIVPKLGARTLGIDLLE